MPRPMDGRGFCFLAIMLVSILTMVEFCGKIISMRAKLPGYINQVPSFAKQEAYNFDVDKRSLEIYHELSQISEEIERCRLENI